MCLTVHVPLQGSPHPDLSNVQRMVWFGMSAPFQRERVDEPDSGERQLQHALRDQFCLTDT